MPRISVDTQIQKLRAQRHKLEKAEQQLLSRTHAQALKKIVQIAHAAELGVDQIAKALAGVKLPKAKAGQMQAPAPRAKVARTKAPRAKVPAKYRNPSDPNQTWSGRGLMPHWLKALKENGTLESALIKT
jgi:DNA-binding protein H-NS